MTRGMHKRDKCLSTGDYHFWWSTKCGRVGGRGTTTRLWAKTICKQCIAKKPKTVK